jgi:uncharacterized LabA/DUF88 family protein
MFMKNNTPTPLALLIDAENVSCKNIEQIMREADKLGDPIVRRMYGDFTKQNMACWHEISLRHAFTVAQRFAYKKGKNCSDIELIMDAIELQYTSAIEGLIIVSGDSDFSGLVQRYRIKNKPVYIMGGQNTAEVLRHNASRFIEIIDKEDKPTSKPQALCLEPIYRVPAPNLPGLTVKGKIDLETNSFIQKVISVINACSLNKGPVKKMDFLKTFQLHYPNTSIREQGFKTWQAYFKSLPNLFQLATINNEDYIQIQTNSNK